MQDYSWKVKQLCSMQLVLLYLWNIHWWQTCSGMIIYPQFCLRVKMNIWLSEMTWNINWVLIQSHLVIWMSHKNWGDELIHHHLFGELKIQCFSIMGQIYRTWNLACLPVRCLFSWLKRSNSYLKITVHNFLVRALLFQSSDHLQTFPGNKLLCLSLVLILLVNIRVLIIPEHSHKLAF